MLGYGGGMRDKPDVIDAEFTIVSEPPKPVRKLPIWERYELSMAPGWWVVGLSSGILGLLSALRP